MGLFSRRQDAAQTKSNQPGRKSFGHAAFAAEDVEDARRGRPGASLQAFAAGAGLEFRASEVAGAFLSTLPVWPEYVFNVCRGRTASGRFGQIAHELFEMRAHAYEQNPGTLHDLRPKRMFDGLVISQGGQEISRENKPFALQTSVWLPTTTAHVRAHETRQLPTIRITRFSPPGTSSPAQSNDLDRFGLPGYSVMEGDQDKALLARICDTVRPWLASRPEARVNLRVRYGLVALTVNGFCSDDRTLRNLLHDADEIANTLSSLASAAKAVPFDAYGPSASTVAIARGIPVPEREAREAFARAAAKLGMFNEDISHLLTLLPRCPIPGLPSGVLAGRLPGIDAPVRVVWHQHGDPYGATFRGGVIVPARPGASTPLGGVLAAETGMYVEVVDGYVACWRKQRSVGALECDELVRLATRSLSASGLAAT